MQSLFRNYKVVLYLDRGEVHQDENMMNSIRNMALEDQLVDALMKKASVTLETSSFDAIMKPSQG